MSRKDIKYVVKFLKCFQALLKSILALTVEGFSTGACNDGLCNHTICFSAFHLNYKTQRQLTFGPYSTSNDSSFSFYYFSEHRKLGIHCYCQDREFL